MAETYWLRGDKAKARAYADTSRIETLSQLKNAPDDEQLELFLGLAEAYLGRKPDAIRHGEQAVEMMPVSRSTNTGPYFRHVLARIYILTGENEKAIDLLENLLKVPYDLSPGWLRIDPNFAPLKGNPRFDKLIAGTS